MLKRDLTIYFYQAISSIFRITFLGRASKIKELLKLFYITMHSKFPAKSLPCFQTFPNKIEFFETEWLSENYSPIFVLLFNFLLIFSPWVKEENSFVTFNHLTYKYYTFDGTRYIRKNTFTLEFKNRKDAQPSSLQCRNNI